MFDNESTNMGKDPLKLPLRSRATRTFAARSKSSIRGFVFAQLQNDFCPRQITYESGLERAILLHLLANPQIIDIWDQPPAVTYPTKTGRMNRHIFDFLITLKRGDKIAIAVKPEEQARRIAFRGTLGLIKQSMPRSFATEAVLMTEASFTRTSLRTVEMAYWRLWSVERDINTFEGANE